MPEPLTDLEIHPLTPERWTDLETLFGPSGASSGCWCMWWRASSADYEQNHGEPNRQAFKSVVASGAQTGLLAYQNGQPVGWVSFAPREDFPRLERSRTLKRVDSQPVWSIVCFFISRKARRRGLSAALIEQRCELCRSARRCHRRGLSGGPRARALIPRRLHRFPADFSGRRFYRSRPPLTETSHCSANPDSVRLNPIRTNVTIPLTIPPRGAP